MMKNKSPNISTYFYSEKDYQDDYLIFRMYPSQKETWVPFKSYEIHVCITSVVLYMKKFSFSFN